MAKKEITRQITLQIPAGKATPAPPVGTVLGPAGINLQEFCTKFNDATRDKMGDIVPVQITIYDDRTFDMVLKTPPAAFLLKKVAGIKSGSSKGETVADTVRMVGCYSDIIAMRHPKEGAPYVASQKSTVPIINAGDGGHNHPTQTLTDLLTIQCEKNRLDNLTIGLCGDLKFGRTVHSLITAMSRYKNIKFVLISPDELKLPDYVKRDVLEKNNIEYIETKDIEEYLGDLDILYMTRVQKERFFNEEDYVRLKDYYILNKEKLKKAKEDLCIMHPLPRVNEIATDVDDDPRACYFKQANYGKYIRMALILKLLEVK